jgi:hypothetical protein
MRRVASALMRCAARIMPVARADWSAAMESELQEIEVTEWRCVGRWDVPLRDAGNGRAQSCKPGISGPD